MTIAWSTACPDWEKRIVERRSLIPFAPLFASEAEAALTVFKSLRIVDAPGQPTFGAACEEWVFDFVRAIFGAYDRDEGRRLIREFFLLISKKNSKSTIAAGIMITALVRNWRNSAELLILAPTLEIANNAFKPAADMVRADPDLNDLMQIQDNLRQITHRTTRAFLKVVAADTDTVGGKKAAFVLIDELWIFGKRPNADAMLREATGGLVARPEGFIIYLSTQSDAPPAGIFKQKLDYFRDVRDGRIEDRKSLAVIYEYPAEMLKAEAYLHPASFYVTNPNLGKSVDQTWLEEEMVKELAGDGATRRTFLAKHLNVEIGMNLRGDRWSGADFWLRTADPCIDLDLILAECEAIVVGIDGGGLDDLFGLTVLGRVRSHDLWYSWSHAWCHDGVLERRKSIASQLRDFVRDGDLTIVDDQLQDMTEMVELCERINEAGLLAAVALDIEGPYGEFMGALAKVGITDDGDYLIGVRQGGHMMNCIKTTERRLVRGLIRHAPSTMMNWCVANLKIEATATTIRATKQNAGDAKIDPIMALFDAVDVMMTHPEPKDGRLVYETQDLRVL